MIDAMAYVKRVVVTIRSLPNKEFRLYVFIGIACLSVLLGIIQYMIYGKSIFLSAQIKKSEASGQKIDDMVHQLSMIHQEEEKITQMLDRYKDFSINVYFENFIKEQGVVPAEGWSTTAPELLSAGFDKITLPATFKNLTTKKIVSMLQALRKQENIYVERWRIKKDMKSKQLTLDMVIATHRHRA